MPEGPSAVEALGTAPGGVALTLHQAAELVGAYRWTEERLFALTGRWSTDAGMAPEAQVHLYEASSQHAWHADLWTDRLPALDGFDRDAVTRPSGPVLGPLLGALEAERAAPGRLAGLSRVVLPELAAVYRGHLRRAVPVTDGPVIRTLHLVLADLDAEETAFERVLAQMAAGDHRGTAGDPTAEAAAAVQRLERVLDRSAGVATTAQTVPRPVRLVPWPVPER